MSAIETMLVESTGPASLSRGPGSGVQAFWAAGRRHFQAWRMLRRTRVHLADLTDEQLLDVGLTRKQAETEMARSLLVTTWTR